MIFIKTGLMVAFFFVVYLGIGLIGNWAVGRWARWRNFFKTGPAGVGWRDRGRAVLTKPWGAGLAGAGIAAAGLLGAWDPGPAWAGIFLAALAGSLTPEGWRRWSESRRRRELERQLPGALELIANALRAGLSLPQSLETAAREIPLPLGGEFQRVVRDSQLGLPPEEALEQMLLRWPHRDLELFVVAAKICRRTGGNLAELSVRLAGTVRERFRLQGRIASLTAQGRLSGWVVGLMPPALFFGLFALDPDMMKTFLRHPLGAAVVGLGLVMEGLGVWFIRRVVAIDA